MGTVVSMNNEFTIQVGRLCQSAVLVTARLVAAAPGYEIIRIVDTGAKTKRNVAKKVLADAYDAETILDHCAMKTEMLTAAVAS